MRYLFGPWAGSRRRFLAWVGALAAGGVMLPQLRRRREDGDLSLKEAEFYRRAEGKK